MGCCYGLDKHKDKVKTKEPVKRTSSHVEKKEVVIEQDSKATQQLTRQPIRQDGSWERDKLATTDNRMEQPQVTVVQTNNRMQEFSLFKPHPIDGLHPSEVHIYEQLPNQALRHIESTTVTEAVAQPQLVVPPQGSPSKSSEEDLLEVVNDDGPPSPTNNAPPGLRHVESRPINDQQPPKPPRFPPSRPQRIQIPTFDYGGTHK